MQIEFLRSASFENMNHNEAGLQTLNQLYDSCKQVERLHKKGESKSIDLGFDSSRFGREDLYRSNRTSQRAVQRDSS